MIFTVRLTALATAAACCLTMLSPAASNTAAAQGITIRGLPHTYHTGHRHGGRAYSGYGNGPYVYRSFTPYSQSYTTNFQYGYGPQQGFRYGGSQFYRGNYRNQYNPYQGRNYSPYGSWRF